MSAIRFQLGIERLCDRPALLGRRRVGLVAHPASVDTGGVHTALRLRQLCGKRLVTLFGPEHGFYGRGGAGEEIGDTRHAAWQIPIRSLYGDHRKPTAEMLADLDAVVFDLQDIAVRCYTFVTTLRYVMEACAEQGKRLMVCDRPVPLPNVVDGPLPVAGLDSFVAVDFALTRHPLLGNGVDLSHHGFYRGLVCAGLRPWRHGAVPGSAGAFF